MSMVCDVLGSSTDNVFEKDSTSDTKVLSNLTTTLLATDSGNAESILQTNTASGVFETTTCYDTWKTCDGTIVGDSLIV